ncbi:MAG: ketopantoate reductase family protein [Halobacteriales archaeon]
MRVQVFGAGSLGTLIGAVLSDAGVDVHLVGRKRVVRGFEDGVRVTGTEEFVAHPSFSTEPRDADITLVTVKSYDTDAAAEALASTVGENDTVVSLQNGMGNEEILDGALDATVLGGTATYGANLRADEGVVGYAGEGRVHVGDYRGGECDEARRVADGLDGLRAEPTGEMDVRLWEKLAVNAAINPVTALVGARNGEAAERAGEVMRRAGEEVETVAAERGVDIKGSADRAVEVAEATADNVSSTLQDVRRGRRTEIEALNGYVVNVAEETGVDVPTNRTLTSLVRAVQRTK